MSLPEWSGAFEDLESVLSLPLPGDAREWAWGGSTGAGIKVAVLDSGVDGDHPAVGQVSGYVALVADAESESGFHVLEGRHEDLVGHGTACAGIIRGLAPDVELYSVRVLGENLKGKGALLLAGIEWAVDARMDVVNLSLSSKSEQLFAPLHDVADAAYFGNTLLVCAANNVPGPTYPSQFASVVSVAATPGSDPLTLVYNPHPPVEFGAIGIDIDVPWSGGSMVATGNSFAAPHVAGMATLIRAKHPDLTPFQVKAVLHAVSQNAHPDQPAARTSE